MKFEATSINFLWTNLMVDELLRSGIDMFCLSPGSRSAPLAAAIGKLGGERVVTHFDERGAAFYAIGYARATGKPAVLVCTSGTAAANYYPAIVEASNDNLPLIILTADRPPELRETGANQTIEQTNLYGDYVRWRFDLPCPDKHIPPEFVLTTIDQAVSRATGNPSGPVHINCMFREPLAPVGELIKFESYASHLANWKDSSDPYTTYERNRNQVSREIVENIASLAAKTEPILVIGRLASDTDRQAALRLAKATGWTTLPDIQSGLRLGCSESNVITNFDQILLSKELSVQLRPDCIIHVGTQLVSKRLQEFVASSQAKNYIHVSSDSKRLDPSHSVTTHVECNISSFCDGMAESIKQSQSGSLAEQWQNASASVARAVEDSLDTDERTEPGIAGAISRLVQPGGAIFSASSRPIRDLDSFADGSGPSVPLAANRGASGIDGTVASAVGFATGLGRTVTLLIGDLALLHDLNSLALAAKSKQPVVIVVINNGGGGIFSFLPIAECAEIFEPMFATPHKLSFDKAAKMFSLDYFAPSTISEFLKAYTDAQACGKSTVIELVTNRDSNVAFHRKIAQAVRSALANI